MRKTIQVYAQELASCDPNSGLTYRFLVAGSAVLGSTAGDLEAVLSDDPEEPKKVVRDGFRDDQAKTVPGCGLDMLVNGDVTENGDGGELLLLVYDGPGIFNRTVVSLSWPASYGL